MARRKKIEKGVIDVTPTWSAILPLVLSLYENVKTRDMAIHELKRMAKAADKYNETIKIKK